MFPSENLSMLFHTILYFADLRLAGVVTGILFQFSRQSNIYDLAVFASAIKGNSPLDRTDIHLLLYF